MAILRPHQRTKQKSRSKTKCSIELVRLTELVRPLSAWTFVFIGFIGGMVTVTKIRRIPARSASPAVQFRGRCHATNVGGPGRHRNRQAGPPEEDNAGHQAGQGHPVRETLQPHGLQQDPHPAGILAQASARACGLFTHITANLSSFSWMFTLLLNFARLTQMHVSMYLFSTKRTGWMFFLVFFFNIFKIERYFTFR